MSVTLSLPLERVCGRRRMWSRSCAGGSPGSAARFRLPLRQHLPPRLSRLLPVPVSSLPPALSPALSRSPGGWVSTWSVGDCPGVQSLWHRTVRPPSLTCSPCSPPPEGVRRWSDIRDWRWPRWRPPVGTWTDWWWSRTPPRTPPRCSAPWWTDSTWCSTGHRRRSHPRRHGRWRHGCGAVTAPCWSAATSSRGRPPGCTCNGRPGRSPAWDVDPAGCVR